MSLYKTLKTVGLAVALVAGMTASAAVGYFSGKSTSHRAGYLGGYMDGKTRGETELLEKVEKYAPKTIDKIMSGMEGEKVIEEFGKTIDSWLGPVDDSELDIEPDFDKWLEEVPEQPAPEKKTPSTPRIRHSTPYSTHA